MSLALSFHDVEYATAQPERPGSQRLNTVGMGSPKRSRRRATQLRTHVRVPMLNWPADLFSDNASIGELMVEDFPLQWDLTALSPGQESPGMPVQAAA